MKNPPIIFLGNGPLSKIPLEKIKSTHLPLITEIHEKTALTTLPQFLANKPTPIGILASFGKIIPKNILDLFTPYGILNIHPSLLPKYRGPSPIETALLNGDTTTGVSIIKLTPKMDAGPIYAQTTVKITPTTTKQSLYTQLSTLGIDTLLSILPSIINSTLHPTPQDESKATYTKILTKSMSPLDPKHKTALELSREIRAFAGFPKSKLQFRGLSLTITAAHPATKPKTILDPKCRDNTYLVIDQLIPEGSRPMSAPSFLNGLRPTTDPHPTQP